MISKLYEYVGSPALRRPDAPAGSVIATLAACEAWAALQSPEGGIVAATFVIDQSGRLLLAPRRSEHVACAGGAAVQSAGEMFFADGPLRLQEVTNQSTGYCAEPESWPAVAAALDRLPLPHPGGFTTALLFRRCVQCGQKNLVKEGWFVCGCCQADLPLAWNFA